MEIPRLINQMLGQTDAISIEIIRKSGKGYVVRLITPNKTFESISLDVDKAMSFLENEVFKYLMTKLTVPVYDN